MFDKTISKLRTTLLTYIQQNVTQNDRI